MNHQFLIEELTASEAGIIAEESMNGAGKDMYLNGIFMMADIKNRNGRVYPITEISRAVEIARQTITERKGIMGELDHPQTLSVNLDRVSHVITDLYMEGSNAIGRAKLLNTPMGNIAKELVRSGVSLGVSSRGAGAVNESGGVTGFQFVTVDIVATPSAPQAYPSTIHESLELAKNGKNIIELAEAIKYDESAQDFFKKEILKWLESGVFSKR